MTSPQAPERDAMVCRACGKLERASEGYPCEGCGTFICLNCSLRDVRRCSRCAAGHEEPEKPS